MRWREANARLGRIKAVADGSIQGFTGYLTTPYHRQPEGRTNYCGYAMRSRDALVDMVKKNHRAGYQVATAEDGARENERDDAEPAAAELPDELEAAEFLIDKLKSTKQNSEFFDSMNARSARCGKGPLAQG